MLPNLVANIEQNTGGNTEQFLLASDWFQTNVLAILWNVSEYDITSEQWIIQILHEQVP